MLRATGLRPAERGRWPAIYCNDFAAGLLERGRKRRGCAATQGTLVRRQFQGAGDPSCITDGGLWVETEHGGEVERVRPVSEGFFELAVDAQAFQGLP